MFVYSAGAGYGLASSSVHVDPAGGGGGEDTGKFRHLLSSIPRGRGMDNLRHLLSSIQGRGGGRSGEGEVMGNLRHLLSSIQRGWEMG